MAPASPDYYERDSIVAEYLLFHYGEADDILPSLPGVQPPSGVLGFPSRCVTETFSPLPSGGRALDLGCAVGRATFEFARLGLDALGIDYSRAFIDAAKRLLEFGELAAMRKVEGEIEVPFVVRRPDGIEDLSKVRFQQGDAMHLPDDIGRFDAVLMANLIDRLRDPSRCLARLSDLVVPGGQVVITSPYTWLEEFTPRACWVGGRIQDGRRLRTLEGLGVALGQAFDLVRVVNLPFLIREHDRKFQWSIAEASVWQRRVGPLKSGSVG